MNENKSYKNMELKFNKNGDAYVAEFEATDKFNLHMEGLLLGSFSILQRTAGGNYTHVRDIPTYPRFDKVFDYDFEALVYPKFIKIVSEVEPTYAEVVSDGEITEIKSQTKEVEVTANGTTQVAPDAGFSYLTGVSIKTNVPQSGGSGGGSAAEYIDISGLQAELAELQMVLARTSILGAAVVTQGGITAKLVLPPVLLENLTQTAPDYIKIDVNEFLLAPVGTTEDNKPLMKKMTIAEYLSTAFGLPTDYFSTLPRITEEEFYNLEGGGITDKFVSIRELYQTNLMDNMDTSGTITLTEGVSKVTAISVEVPADWSSLVDTLFSLGANGANQDNPKLYTITVTPSNESCMIGTTGSQMDLIKNGEIVQSTLDEVNSELSSGEYYYLGGYQNLSEDKLDTLDKFIKVKTV